MTSPPGEPQSDTYEVYAGEEDAEFEPMVGNAEEEDEEVVAAGEESSTIGWTDFRSEMSSKSVMYERGFPEMKSEGSAESLRELSIPTRYSPQKESIFVHSAPSQFPDIAKASKSAFGSIFVRASVRKIPGSFGIGKKPVPSGQFNMIPVSMDDIEKDSFSDGGRRAPVKGSIFRFFEKRGIRRDVSVGSDSQWDMYPITKSALFSLQIQDHIHHTRNLSKVEERILSTPAQVLKFAHIWSSGSTWTGHWDGLGMAGTGTYVMPHDVCYVGNMQDGMCHDADATLIYPNGFKALHCNYVNGELTNYQFEFPDSLRHEKENWKYCQYPDRRFWSEIQNGLKPAKIAQKTQTEPPRKIPQGFYDTSDGFYNPKTKVLSGNEGKMLRVPTQKEEEWIKAKCRKGFYEFTGFRPEYYENWYNNDKEFIQTIKDMQEKYSAGEITCDEFGQFYADHNLLPACLTFKKAKKPSEIYTTVTESYPTPRRLAYRLEKIFQGHRIPLRDTSPGPPRKPRSSMRRPKVKRDGKTPSQEKLSWKIKFNRNYSRSAALPAANHPMEDKDSKPTLKKFQQPMANEKEAHGVTKHGSIASLTPKTEPKTLKDTMKDVVMDIVNEIVLEERERHRNRLVRTQSIGNLSFGPKNEKEVCYRVLEKLYSSISDTDEFCDSVPQYACDLRKLARDRFQSVKFWGKKIFTLNFEESD